MQPLATKHQGPGDIEQVVREYVGFVRSVVAKIPNSSPNVFDFEDLVQFGMIGLLAAASSYDSSRGVPFMAWSKVKIQSAVRDALRKADSERRKNRPTQIRLFDVYAYEDDTTLIDNALSPKASHLLRSCLRDLPAEQGLILLLQAHGLTQKKIASVMRVPSKRVSQESAQALALLRERLMGNLEALVCVK